MRPARAILRRRGGFTLAEVAVTIVIVGMALLLVVQGLQTSKLVAAHTRNLKVARELALQTLGQVESGLFEEETDQDHLFGSYADEGWPDFEFELVLGEESFLSAEDYDRWDPWRADPYDDDDEDESESEQPYEKVQIKVTFPPIQGFQNELVLERWIPWKQVYRTEEEEDEEGSRS